MAIEGVPKCGTCGGELAVATGLPVSVTFDSAGHVATVSTDLTELSCDLETHNFPCPTEGCETVVSDEAHDWFVARLERISERAAPALDIEVD